MAPRFPVLQLPEVADSTLSLREITETTGELCSPAAVTAANFPVNTNCR